MKKENKNNWVEIHDLCENPPRVYLAKSVEDCSDKTDQLAYTEAVRLGETITVGLVIGCPYRFTAEGKANNEQNLDSGMPRIWGPSPAEGKAQ